ncbi:MAG: hypothetical protein ACK542_11365 [Burkholderiales bacterium]
MKPTVRSIEGSEGVLIFDDTIQEKAWTDESELIFWHYDHVSGRFIAARGKQFILALKDNRLVALSEEDKRQGRFKRVDELQIPEQGLVRCWLKGYAKEVLVVSKSLKTKTTARAYCIWFAAT